MPTTRTRKVIIVRVNAPFPLSCPTPHFVLMVFILAVAMAKRVMAASNAAVSPGMPGRSPPGAPTTSTGGAGTGASGKPRPAGGGGEAAGVDGRILEVPNLRVFTFAELRAATRNFKADTVLGEGGFGRVHKGWVDERTMSPARNGAGSMPVAVKKLNPESLQGVQEWQVRTLSGQAVVF
jgi:hypothetical protein